MKFEDRPIMKCGCVAMATCSSFGGKKFDPPIPSCVIHGCIEVMDTPPNLTGRMSRCAYGAHDDQPSSRDLPFFEYRGLGSPDSLNQCTCGFYKAAHDGQNRYCKCENFVPHGPFEFDRHYCGCRGWD